MGTAVSRNPVIDYEDAWVALIDILGFRSIVEEAVKAGEERQKIRELVGALGTARNPAWHVQHALRELRLSIRMFSDTICVAAPAGHPSTGAVVIQAALTVQQTLACSYGMLVRGAVVRGMHHDNDDLIFSPALIEAHEAEQTRAVYPRILVLEDGDPFGEEEYTGDQFDQFCRSLLLSDVDGQRFLSYLNGVQFRDPDKGRQILMDHKRHILGGLDDYAAKPRVLAKYRWAATYHNRFCCDTLCQPDNRDLLIEGTGIDIRSQFMDFAPGDGTSQ